MIRIFTLMLTATTLICFACFGKLAHAESLTAQQQLAFDIYKELVEINTVTETGDTARAAEAMAARLRAAGFSGSDVQVFMPAARKGNLVARLRGTGARKPILLLAHLDVVPARREDWSVDPFKLIEKDGYFYARGSIDLPTKSENNTVTCRRSAVSWGFGSAIAGCGGAWTAPTSSAIAANIFRLCPSETPSSLRS